MVKLASSLLNEWESGDAPRTAAINIVHAQTILLLVIDADWRCSPTISSLLARAVALANNMGLWRHPNMELASVVDSDDNLSVRIWWSLVVMDRWHAVGTGRPVLITMRSVVPPAGLDIVLSDVSFYLSRKCAFQLSTSLSVFFSDNVIHRAFKGAEPSVGGDCVTRTHLADDGVNECRSSDRFG
jgi:hypothetical protein